MIEDTVSVRMYTDHDGIDDKLTETTILRDVGVDTSPKVGKGVIHEQAPTQVHAILFSDTLVLIMTSQLGIFLN